MNTRHPLPEGALVTVMLHCEEPAVRLSLNGRVTRSCSFGNLTNETPGMLIELLDLDEAMLAELHSLARSARQVCHGMHDHPDRLYGSMPL